MKDEKIQLAILCGGQSAEHEISIVSAKNVMSALDKSKYRIYVILINKKGEWFLFSSPDIFLEAARPESLLPTAHCEKVSLIFGNEKEKLVTIEGKKNSYEIHVAFPILHGSHGEDGTIQGLLELANIPYVGPGVLSSAVCMDKEISKQLLRAEKIPVVDFIVAYHHNADKLKFKEVSKKLGLPFFVKPANTGSSVGISKVKNQKEFEPAIKLALQFDTKILMEQFILGREIECAVLGNEFPEASVPGEIVTSHEFYTYEAKYIDPKGADLIIPAKLPKPIIKKVQALAKKAFSALKCEGMARIDFFIDKKNKVYINEANTIPGFTQISMYPKMWVASGVSYDNLLDKLIHLALKRFERDRVLVLSRIQK